MPWARIDDALHSHPKILQTSLAALGLHLLGLSYAADYLTDGFLPTPWVRRTTDDPELAGELVQYGFWIEAEGGYRIHDYLDYNPSKADYEARLERQRNGGQKGARIRWGEGSSRG